VPEQHRGVGRKRNNCPQHARSRSRPAGRPAGDDWDMRIMINEKQPPQQQQQQQQRRRPLPSPSECMQHTAARAGHGDGRSPERLVSYVMARLSDTRQKPPTSSKS